MTMRARGVVLLAATFLLFGCRSAARSRGAEASLTQWKATEDLRIGSESNPGTSLTYVGSLAVGPNGDVYVTQPQNADIRVFDGDGHPVRTIGRRGGGPGEFQSVSTMGFFGDTLYALDPGATRVTFFSDTGAVLGTLSTLPKGLKLPQGFILMPPFKLCADGTGFAAPDAFSRSPAARLPRPYLRVHRDGTVVDTLMMLPTAHSMLAVQTERMGFYTRQPFSDDPLESISCRTGEAAVVDRRAAEDAQSATFRVTVLRSTHDTLYSRSYPYAPMAMPTAWVDSAIARTTRGVGRMLSNARQAEAAVRKAMFIPKYVAPVSRALYATTGDLWLRRENAPRQDEHWMVLDSLGTPIARVTLPSGLDVRVIEADAVWGTVSDSLDVPYVVRYRIER